MVFLESHASTGAAFDRRHDTQWYRKLSRQSSRLCEVNHEGFGAATPPKWSMVHCCRGALLFATAVIAISSEAARSLCWARYFYCNFDKGSSFLAHWRGTIADILHNIWSH